LFETTKHFCFIDLLHPTISWTAQLPQQQGAAQSIIVEEEVTNEPQRRPVYEIRYLRRTCGCLHCRTGIEEKCAFRTFTGPEMQQNLTENVGMLV
jgi:hypothetical protein